MAKKIINYEKILNIISYHDTQIKTTMKNHYKLMKMAKITLTKKYGPGCE